MLRLWDQCDITKLKYKKKLESIFSFLPKLLSLESTGKHLHSNTRKINYCKGNKDYVRDSFLLSSRCSNFCHSRFLLFRSWEISLLVKSLYFYLEELFVDFMLFYSVSANRQKANIYDVNVFNLVYNYGKNYKNQ